MDVVEKVCYIIDRYPDYSFYFILVVSWLSQVAIGNSLEVLVFSMFLMLFDLLIVLPSNILVKNLVKAKRPKNYYVHHGPGRSLFEGSFPSFHTQFSFSEATVFTTTIWLLAPEHLRDLATVVALVVTGGLAAIVAWSRIHLGVHYPVDVIGGIVLGVPIGYITVYMLSPILKGVPIRYQVLGSIILLLLVHVFARRERAKAGQ